MMLTYGRKKKSILPKFSAFRSSSRFSNNRDNPFGQETQSASCMVLPQVSDHSSRTNIHDDSIDDLASQILSDDSTFNAPAAPSLYRNPRHSMTMPHLPSLQSNDQSSRNSGPSSFANTAGSSGDSQFLEDSTDPLNDPSRDSETQMNIAATREFPPLIPRKSSKRASRKHKGHVRRLIGGGPVSRPQISEPILIGSSATVLQNDPCIDNSIRSQDIGAAPLVVIPTATAMVGNHRRGTPRESSSMEISDPSISSSTSATVSCLPRRFLSTASNPAFTHLSSTTADNVQRGATTTHHSVHISRSIDGRNISGPINLRHISGHTLSNTASSFSAVDNEELQATPSAMGSYRPQLVLPPSTGNIGLDIQAKVAAMQAHTLALKGDAPYPEKPRAESSRNVFQKAKAAIESFGKKRETVLPHVDSRQNDPKYISEDDSGYIDPDIIWKEDDISWEDAENQLPRMEKILNEAQSLANPKIAARYGTFVPRKRVPDDGRSIRTKKSFHTDEQISNDPFSDHQQMRENSQEGNSSGGVNSNHIATNLDDNRYRAFTNDDTSIIPNGNDSGGYIDNDMSTTYDGNNSINQDSISALSSEEIPELPARAQHLREEFSSARNHHSNIDDMLLSSSPLAQSTPRIRLEPSFERDGTTRLRNVSASSRSLFDPDNSSLRDHTDMDLDTSSLDLNPGCELNNLGKRKSSPIQEQSIIVSEPEVPDVLRYKRAKKHPSPSKQELKTLEIALNKFPHFEPKLRKKHGTFSNNTTNCSKAATSRTYPGLRVSLASSLGKFPKFEPKPYKKRDANSKLVMSRNASSASTDENIVDSDTQDFGHALAQSRKSDDGENIYINLDMQDSEQTARNHAMTFSASSRRRNGYLATSGSSSFGRSISDTDMLTKAGNGSGRSANTGLVSPLANARRLGDILNRKDVNVLVVNSQYPAPTGDSTLRDRNMANGSKDELSEPSEDHDVSRGFGRLHLGQTTSISGDNSSRHKKSSGPRPAREHARGNGNRVRNSSRTEVRRTSRRDYDGSVMDIDELQMDQTALMNPK